MVRLLYGKRWRNLFAQRKVIASKLVVARYSIKRARVAWPRLKRALNSRVTRRWCIYCSFCTVHGSMYEVF